MRAIERSGAFKRDYCRIKASPRHRDLEERLKAILELLIEDRSLLPAYRDPALTGNWVGYRECHVLADLMLIYDSRGLTCCAWSGSALIATCSGDGWSPARQGSLAMTTPETGAEASVELTVTPADPAARLGVEPGEAYPEVLATRTVVGEMERAAAKLLRPYLRAGQLAVGVRVEIEHMAPTPVGARVVTSARYLGLDGKLHLFVVDAFDPGGRIGHGRHARAIVEEACLLAGASKRRASSATSVAAGRSPKAPRRATRTRARLTSWRG